MFEYSAEPGELCFGCVYYPPNLPPHTYAPKDWGILQSRQCSFEHKPGDNDCLTARKTSCSLVDPGTLKHRSC